MSGRDDRGFATVWAAGAVLAILLVYTLLMSLGAATVARHRAAAVADLAALAAAADATSGTGAACDAAGRVADRMSARLYSCELREWDAVVEVRVPPPMVPGEFGAARAVARAGPVDG
ncbi:Rv3654c family TadE-like protein [Haloechinothrix sp. LS1_15]|uniref:Rv3654c family TadE-like protein n=1 Tax=Haloechinothrix sp. LS1_15 TaxID=2652248 RepID=UPI00294761BE|nr:Rv3654c family TadE-like protein [Haloechinothrix sp. LS1_15]MDV6011363.1 flp pilus-assembly TadE/G-like family protein [Haloechinothrix sp. LS1_15]